jgi:hypothetical protein
VVRVCSSLVAAFFAALVLVSGAFAVRVHVRVEGKTKTIFGPTAPVLDVAATRLGATSPNALDALESASALGEFFYHLTITSFGPYVDQIGRYTAGGTTGWVFKLNGASPPVGADQVQLRDSDSVLWYWADFGPSGGPPTLILRRSGRCYSVLAQDDAGKTSVANGAVLHLGARRLVATRKGRACIARHGGLLVRATLAGAVRSVALP